MAIRKLERDQWQDYFARISKRLLGMRAEIEVAALNIGDQLAANWVPMLSIVYNTKDDALEIALEGLNHKILAPREVYVDENPAGLGSFEVVDADNVRHIVQLREPLMLPPLSAVR